MPVHSSRRRRRSIRLRGYDYAQPGAYFVTVVVHGRKEALGAVEAGAVRRSAAGRIVDEVWRALPTHFPAVRLDAFVLMPNHVHGIVWIEEVSGEGAETTPLQTGARRPTLGRIVAYFKYQTTRRINQLRGTPGQSFWQRNYYERVIRNERELNARRECIGNNPLNWMLDAEYVDPSQAEA